MFRLFYSLLFFIFLSISASAQSFSDGDIAKGKKLFRKCAACHQIGEGAKNRVGPILTGVIGRPAASVEGYKYGKHLKQAGEDGLVWSKEEIFAWLGNPKKFLSEKLDDKKAKTKMSLRLKKEAQRYDVIAYLSTFSE